MMRPTNHAARTRRITHECHGTLSSRCLEAPLPLTPSEGRDLSPHTRSMLRAPINRADARGSVVAAR